MNKWFQGTVLLSISLIATVSFAVGNIEQVVIIRHAEKPFPNDLGQLSPKGLKRSLMLSEYFRSNFVKPDFIFAPNPSVQKRSYDYIRPLATIEPTAICLSMPVNTQIGFNQPTKLVQELLQDKYHNSTIFVAWAHTDITKITRQLLKQFNNHSKVSKWSDDDYNSVYVFQINWDQKPQTIDFKIEQERFSLDQPIFCENYQKLA